VRLVFSTLTALTALTVGGVFQGRWKSPWLLGWTAAFLAVPALRLLLVLRERWTERRAGIANLAEVILAAGLMLALKVHLPEGARFLLEPFAFPFVLAHLVFVSRENNGAMLLACGGLAAAFRLGAVAFALSQGVIFTAEYAYLDRFAFLGHEVAWIVGIVGVTFAGLVPREKLMPSHTRSAVPKADEDTKLPLAVSDRKGPEIRTGFLIFVDIRDFSNLSNKQSPGQVRRLLRDYHERFDAVIGRHGGTVENRDGDGILGHFGIHRNDPTSAKSGMSCLEEMLSVADQWNEERAAQNECFVECGFSGVVANFFIEKKGNSDRLELSLVGESVNLIQHLEKHNKKISARASTTRQTLEMAAAQGFVLSNYVRSLPKEKIENLNFKLDIVVLAERAAPKEEKAA